MFHYPQQATFANHIFMPTRPFVYRSNGPVLNQSTHNLNFTHDFERFPTPHHGFASMPSGGYPFFDYTNHNFDQQRWKQNMARTQQQQQQQPQQQQQQHHHRRTPAFHFQDKSTSYFMTEPIITSDDRITIQLTKVHIGPNGDQQRVFVEQEFSNEKELNKFVRNLRQNFDKTFNNRPSAKNTNRDESTSTDSNKSGVVVVEEPDEEPKVYQQQAYNANIESKKAAAAAASVLTPPMSPPIESTPPPPKFEGRSPPIPPNFEHHRKKKPVSPLISPMSAASAARSNRHHRNKTKYRRQQPDHREDMKSPRVFQMPGFSRQYQATPTPPPFQQRFFIPNNDLNIPPNPNFPWRFHSNGHPKNRSRSYVPSMNDHFPPPPPTPSRFQNTTDPFFRPIPPTRFAHQGQNDFLPPPSPSKFRRSNRRKATQPTTIAENLIYPNHNQQQPRVHRTKSESRNLPNVQQHRSQSSTNHQKFSPLQQPPLNIRKHFVPFRSPPVILTTLHATAPIFHPNQRRQFANMQPQLRLINHFRLGTNRF